MKPFKYYDANEYPFFNLRDISVNIQIVDDGVVVATQDAWAYSNVGEKPPGISCIRVPKKSLLPLALNGLLVKKSSSIPKML